MTRSQRFSTIYLPAASISRPRTWVCSSVVECSLSNEYASLREVRGSMKSRTPADPSFLTALECSIRFAAHRKLTILRSPHFWPIQSIPDTSQSQTLCVGVKLQILSRESYSNINKKASFELEGGLFAGKSWRQVLTSLFCFSFLPRKESSGDRT